MMDSEIVINLWAIYDAGMRVIYGLSGKAYNMSGSDAEKLELLKKLSATDYVTAKRYKIPDRFKITYANGVEKSGVVFLTAVSEHKEYPRV